MSGVTSSLYCPGVCRRERKQKLEKAKVEMAADLKARGKEDQLALKLREQWHQKMRVSDIDLLGLWFHVDLLYFFSS